MMNNTNLLLVTIVVMGLSIFSYNNSISRAERFERGQKFLNQLNADNISEIEITKGDEVTQLRRSEDRFIVTSKHNYPAKNESINRFINDTLNIELEKNVGSGESLEQELEISGGEKTINVVLRNDSGKDMVRFVIGKASEDGRGNYVKRLDGDDAAIYLTSKGLYLTTDADNFLAKEILDVKEENIQSIRGKDYAFERKDGGLVLSNLPSGKKENTSNANQVKGMLGGLRFDKVYLADDSTVSNLEFEAPITVALDDNSGYVVEVCKSGEKFFLKVQGTYDMRALEGITVNPDDTEEQLKEKSALLTRRDEIADFNAFHGSWVYELSEYVGKKFLHKRADLMEDASDEG